MAVLQASFPGKQGNEWMIGDTCHQQSDGQVPVCVVTDLKGNILLSSEATDTSRWMVTRARVQPNRFWSASTAFIKCACELTDPTEPLPPITFKEPFRPAYNKNAKDSSESSVVDLADDTKRTVKFPLGQMDEICVYIGYNDQIDESVTKEDLGVKLLRVFVGCIDTAIEAFSPNDGASYSISCRDRMKYLMDSIASFNGADSDRILSEATKEVGKISRKDVILALARRAVGDLRSSSQCGITNCGAYIRDSGQSQGVDYTDGFDGFQNYKHLTGRSTPSGELVYFLGGKTLTPLKEVSVFPKFSIITGRMPYSNGSDLQSDFVVTERVPLEYIKQMSQLEPTMTEVFVDHRTGDFWYCPRGTDTTGLSDSKRMFRTYFNRICPDGVSNLYNTGGVGSLDNNDTGIKVGVTADNTAPNEVHPCQMLILYREEQSTINWRSNIVVSKTNGDSSGEAQSLHLRVRPPRLEGRAFPCTYFNVADPSINSSAEMVGVALAHARNVGKEVRAATAHLVGDPSLTPGEAIQILGNVPKNTLAPTTHAKMLADAIEDKTNFLQYYEDYLSLAKSIGRQVRDATGTDIQPVKLESKHVQVDNGNGLVQNGSITPINPGANTTQTMCDITPGTTAEEGSVPNNQKIVFREDPPTIWRVEGLIHRFNDGKPGFYTELALISPF